MEIELKLKSGLDRFGPTAALVVSALVDQAELFWKAYSDPPPSPPPMAAINSRIHTRVAELEHAQVSVGTQLEFHPKLVLPGLWVLVRTGGEHEADLFIQSLSETRLAVYLDPPTQQGGAGPDSVKNVASPLTVKHWPSLAKRDSHSVREQNMRVLARGHDPSLPSLIHVTEDSEVLGVEFDPDGYVGVTMVEVEDGRSAPQRSCLFLSPDQVAFLHESLGKSIRENRDD